MNILLDLGAIKTGGGAQLAVNFLREFDVVSDGALNVYVLVAANSVLAGEVDHIKVAAVWRTPRSYLMRAVNEYVILPYRIRRAGISKVFTFFGAGLPRIEGVRSIVTVAYPTICYPESDFWRHLSIWRRVFAKGRNWLRCRRLRRVDKILVETDVMRRRVSVTLGVAPDDIAILPPAVSNFAVPIRRRHDRGRTRFVTVSDNTPHKNLWRLYDIAQNLEKKGYSDFVFRLTVTEQAFRRSIKSRPLNQRLLADHFEFVGPVAPTRIMEVYSEADVVVQISDLESFSNTYMEAWRVGLPIIASDRDFAREICGDSAVYVEPHQPETAAAEFMRVAMDAGLRERMVQQGLVRLDKLPTARQRCELIWSLLRE